MYYVQLSLSATAINSIDIGMTARYEAGIYSTQTYVCMYVYMLQVHTFGRSSAFCVLLVCRWVFHLLYWPLALNCKSFSEKPSQMSYDSSSQRLLQPHYCISLALALSFSYSLSLFLPFCALAVA